MSNIFEQIKSSTKIENVVTFYGIKLDKAGKALCPFHNEKTPSFSIKKEDNIFKCFGCGASGDCIDFVAKLKNVGKLDAAKIIAKDFGIVIDDTNIKVKSDIKKYIEDCIVQVKYTDYFVNRGLSNETIERYKLGFDQVRSCVVIPYNSALNYYQQRNINDKKFFKPKTELVGKEPLFNEAALKNTKGSPVFVVESPICAMSIIQCGGEAVSICGTGGGKLLAALAKLSKKPTLIISLDNDEVGRVAAERLSSELITQKTNHIISNISGTYKDPNELLMTDSGELTDNIAKAITQAKKCVSAVRTSISALDLQNTNLEKPVWLVNEILPQGLAIISAQSKMGKSWLMLQLCINVAIGDKFLDFETNKNDCLYFALEDSKIRLKDRLDKVLKGKAAPSNLYVEITANNLDNGLIEQLRAEIIANPNLKLIVIDTLQKIRGKSMKNEGMYSNDYREMAVLKSFADKNKLAILLVHHLRKLKDDDIFNCISGSNGIMGACDTVFVLARKRRNDEEATLYMTGRDIDSREYIISFNKNNYRWEVVSKEQHEEKVRQQTYNNNPLVKVIKALLAEGGGTWSGTSTEIILAADRLSIDGIENPTSIGMAISNMERQLIANGISHSNIKRTRKHVFTKTEI